MCGECVCMYAGYVWRNIAWTRVFMVCVNCFVRAGVHACARVLCYVGYIVPLDAFRMNACSSLSVSVR